MDIGIRSVPSEANDWTVTRAIAAVVHSEDFAPVIEGRLINFRVKLNPSLAGGLRNDGTGTLTLPTEAIGSKFLDYVYNDPIRIDKKKLKFHKQNKPPFKGLALTLAKTPYVNPDIEEERQLTLEKLDVQLRVDSVQFGIFYRAKYPRTEKEPLSPRSFSIEWEREYVKNSIGWLTFEYDHKLLRITLGNELTEQDGSSIAINFASIQKIGTGYDGKPYICFDTLTPPVLEGIQFHRTMTGNADRDNRKYKQRIGSLHEGHLIVAPYSPHLRLELYNDPNKDVISKFISMCQDAGLADSMILRCKGAFQIEALRNGFFRPKRLHELHKTLARFDWPVAFQLESLLHNGLLHTGDLDELIPRVRTLCNKHAKKGAVFVGDLLRRYNEALQVRPARESPMACFQRIFDKFEFSQPRGVFRCCHVTFTPTRMILEGPYATQSNRVIRRYERFEDHFIRVDFRDEDRLQYRWDRAVDGTSFLRARVGSTLKYGFRLAGRQFEFLAYSTSALREHAVWFMNPFDHPEEGRVTGASIRNSLGNFEGTKLLKQPSKYAARLAQAFTATDPSVDIHKSEWEVIPDLICEDNNYMFTDGCGTISKALADRIWKELSEKKLNAAFLIKPSAYQIRFLGYKGVVSIDEQLDKLSNGIHMRLRPSMGKFDVKDDEIAPLEIAQAFEHPNTCYLNRPLVMVLEDVGVRKESFQELQDKADADARTIDDSITQFHDVIASHGLGSSYRLRDILGRLKDKYKMNIKSDGKTISMDNPFLRQIRQVAMMDILRDIKHSARIPVPNSYLLVGVADEGPAYEAAGYENVFCLGVSEIYACIQRQSDPEPIWIEGNVSISRSPVVHPGDVQRVRAIGKPPDDKLCLFRHLKNVVVMPSQGHRSLASCLGGGDVDGDLFSVICHDALLPTSIEGAANYESAGTWTLEDGRDSTVDDICDFIVEYINSDVLGLLSDRLLTIAGKSIKCERSLIFVRNDPVSFTLKTLQEGIHDPACTELAALCSQAVDYPKQGIPVSLDDNTLPRTLIRCKPDWHAAEVVSPRKTDYYESSRALGHLFRSIVLAEPEPISPEELPPVQLLADPITIALLEDVRPFLGDSAFVEGHPSELLKTFRRYSDELRYICATHTLSNTPGTRLLEAEVVVGTILAKCSQKRWRKDRIYRMRLHSATLVRDVQQSLLENINLKYIPELIQGLELAWKAWDLSLRRRNEFGANSFGLVALGTIFECLDNLERAEAQDSAR